MALNIWRRYDLDPGNYDLYFAVDPDNKLDELHED